MRTKDSNSAYYWQIPDRWLNKLTLIQLDSLGDKDKDTYTEFYFRKIQFLKKFDVQVV